MTYETADENGANNTTRNIIIAVVVVVFLCCCCLLLLGVVGPALLGPAIGNVFSNIIEELGTPMP